MRSILTLILLLSLLTFAGAEELFLMNKPFKGKVSGSGLEMYAELREVTRALDLELVESDGAWVVSTDDGSSEAQSGKVMVNGKVVRHQPGPLVNLQDLAEALSLKIVRNATLGTVDVYRAETVKKEEGSSAGGVLSLRRESHNGSYGKAEFLLPVIAKPLDNTATGTSSWITPDEKMQIHLTTVKYPDPPRDPRREARGFSEDLVRSGMPNTVGAERLGSTEVGTVWYVHVPATIDAMRGDVPEVRKSTFGRFSSCSLSIVVVDQESYSRYKEDMERIGRSLRQQADEP